jgi:hypothetical protein
MKREVLPSLDTLLILLFIDLCAGERWGRGGGNTVPVNKQTDFPAICFLVYTTYILVEFVRHL